ncbi:MAG: type II toxin-antitoxin system RelE/ParE family toxin [Kiritimatiellales bacterium]|nr:type II toxin-antitoxin system RelE/ParE family toxin [Kiritimatiellales bacterium]MCF7864169.1 type II toxin-antitoxin system RelE/ParE family toxin [Kiritimatiellales bacterium]
MEFEFSPAAKAEFVDAIDYYENQQPGLGKEFLEEVYATIGQILQYPNGWATLDPTFHRCLTKRFPYGVIYAVENGAVRIYAVMNLHRKPNYWRS